MTKTSKKIKDAKSKYNFQINYCANSHVRLKTMSPTNFVRSRVLYGSFGRYLHHRIMQATWLIRLRRVYLTLLRSALYAWTASFSTRRAINRRAVVDTRILANLAVHSLFWKSAEFDMIHNFLFLRNDFSPMSTIVQNLYPVIETGTTPIASVAHEIAIWFRVHNDLGEADFYRHHLPSTIIASTTSRLGSR